MLSAGRQDFSRAAKGAAGLPRKESLRLFQPQAEGNAFRGTLCQAAPHATKKIQRLAAELCVAVYKLAPQNNAPFVLCPATVRPRKENRGTFGGATVCPAPACLGKMTTTLAARFLRGCYLAGTSFSSLCRTLRLFCSDGICSLFCTACKNTPAYGAGAEARFVYVLVCGLR